MSTEARDSDLSTLTIKDLADVVRFELASIESNLPKTSHSFLDQIRVPDDEIERVLTNIALIDKLRTIPTVQHFLKVTGVEVGILVYNPLRTRQSLYVDSNGYKMVRRDRGNSEKSITLNEAEIRDMEIRPSEDTTDYHFVQEFANVTPRQIVNRFKKAASRPVKVK